MATSNKAPSSLTLDDILSDLALLRPPTDPDTAAPHAFLRLASRQAPTSNEDTPKPDSQDTAGVSPDPIVESQRVLESLRAVLDLGGRGGEGDGRDDDAGLIDSLHGRVAALQAAAEHREGELLELLRGMGE